MFGTTATKPKEKKQHHVPSSSPFSALLVSVNRTRIFPPFSPHTIRLCACVLSRTQPLLRIRDSWDHTLSLLSLYLKKKGCDAWAVPGSRWWRRRKKMSAQKITGVRVGGESKGTSSLSLSSFFFYALLLRGALPHLNAWNRLRASKDLSESSSSIIHLNIPIVQFSNKIERSRLSPLFWMHSGGC